MLLRLGSKADFGLAGGRGEAGLHPAQQHLSVGTAQAVLVGYKLGTWYQLTPHHVAYPKRSYPCFTNSLKRECSKAAAYSWGA